MGSQDRNDHLRVVKILDDVYKAKTTGASKKSVNINSYMLKEESNKSEKRKKVKGLKIAGSNRQEMLAVINGDDD